MTGMDPTPEELADVAARHAYMYATAVGKLADLILDTPPIDDQFAQFVANTEREPMALMLALALRNLSRAAEMAVCNLSGAKQAGLQEQIDSFNRALPDLVHARDMLEHFDEYAAGTGRRQRQNADLIYEVAVSRNDASWMLCVGPHRIDIANARAAANALGAAVLAYTSPNLKLDEAD